MKTMKNLFFAIALISIGTIVYSFVPANTWEGIAKYLKSVDRVTQATSISTAVEIDGRNGVITTVSSTLATNASASFKVNYSDDFIENYEVDDSSIVNLQLQYAGSSGIPIATISAIDDTSFTVKLTALIDTLNAAIKVHYNISN